MLDVNLIRQQGDFRLDVAFRSPDVGVTALFGRSGAGKTSVVNMVAGLVRPDRGHIVVNSRTLFDAAKGLHVPPEKRRVGYIFQDGRLFPHLSVKSNLTYGMHLTPPSERHVALTTWWISWVSATCSTAGPPNFREAKSSASLSAGPC
jgi:molybdate transport system ATP-binding protein